MEKAFTGDLPRQNVDGGQALAEQLSRCEALHSPRATRCRTCVFRRPGIHLGVRKESPGGLARSHCCCMHSFESTHTPCMHRINVRGKPCMHGVNERDATRHGTHLHEADRAIPTVYNFCPHLQPSDVCDVGACISDETTWCRQVLHTANTIHLQLRDPSRRLRDGVPTHLL